MGKKQQEGQELAQKLTGLGYPDFEVLPGEDEVPMLFIQGSLISSASYALTLEGDLLKKLIVETLEVAGGQGT